MNDRLNEILEEIRELEKSVQEEIRRKEEEFQYKIRKGKVIFENGVVRFQKTFSRGLFRGAPSSMPPARQGPTRAIIFSLITVMPKNIAPGLRPSATNMMIWNS
ncbi:MAG: hypothetical protein M1461_12880 [Nitrospirae bacterium]|nr:hypothetical protein [Nitrospirota bacterium]